MPSNGKKTILVVDDVELNRKILSVILQDKYNILEADNGLTAKRVIKDRSGEISLILLDLVMPLMDGFTLLKQLGASGQYRNIPVILVTSEAYEENILEGIKMGVRDVIAKPFQPDLVLRRVDNLILVAETVSQDAQEPGVEAPEPAPVPHTALIVDDVGVNRAILATALEQNYDILEAPDGKQALALLQEHRQEIAVVLLDVMMPVMDGYELMQQAKEQALLGRIPVVAVTAEDTLPKLDRLTELGVCEIIQKPFTPAIVQNRVNYLVKLAWQST